MNLLFDAWLPVRYSDGSRSIVSFDKLRDSDILDFDFPRADFQGAAYQFAIGVLQSLVAPEDEDAWGDYYDQPRHPKNCLLSWRKLAMLLICSPMRQMLHCLCRISIF
nr:type I-E CRISPR-associated protein Cse1/CasA [Nitrincola sp. A-D6]